MIHESVVNDSKLHKTSRIFLDNSAALCYSIPFPTKGVIFLSRYFSSARKILASDDTKLDVPRKDPRKYYCSKNRKRFFKTKFKEQGGKCLICGKQERLVIDHCHKTGLMRGLLCYKHNTGIGLFQDDPEMIRKAIDYLNKFITTIEQDQELSDDVMITLLSDISYPSDRARARKLANLQNCSESTAQTRLLRARKKLGLPKGKDGS